MVFNRRIVFDIFGLPCNPANRAVYKPILTMDEQYNILTNEGTEYSPDGSIAAHVGTDFVAHMQRWGKSRIILSIPPIVGRTYRTLPLKNRKARLFQVLAVNEGWLTLQGTGGSRFDAEYWIIRR